MLGGLDRFERIHFSGIGGIGMSALAGMCLSCGKVVTGSDQGFSEIIEGLSDAGAGITCGGLIHDIKDTVDLLVHTPAISNDHPELLEARRMNIPVLSYPEALGLISKEIFTVAVAGTHGKTTTTAMVAHILENSGMDPMVIVGSMVKGGADEKRFSNFRVGNDNCFVVEACEYKRSFLHLYPDILVITNIEEDHLDCYKDLEDIRFAFEEMVSRVAPGGKLVCLTDDDTVRSVVGHSDLDVLNYGSKRIKMEDLMVPGEHNRNNAKAAVTVAEILGVSEVEAVKRLGSFAGTWRRFEYKGKTAGGALVFDDYAHHPAEISATIEAAMERFKDKRIVVVFQPHLHSRTDFFFDDFVKALSKADHVVLTPVCRARTEDHEPLYSSEQMASSIIAGGGGASFVGSLDGVSELVSSISDKDSIVIMMGAGDIYTATDELLLEKVRLERYTCFKEAIVQKS